MGSPYPAHREADVVLRDGSTVHVRRARSDDRQAVLEFLRELSPDSRMLRFFTASANLEWAANRMTEVDYHDRVSLLATAGTDGRVLAHATYIKMAGERAEVAFAIADTLQGRGLGTILLGQLAEMAEESGIRVFEAQVLPNNRRMIDVFRESGFPVSMRSEPGTMIVEFPTSLTAEALERFERREQMAAVAAMEHFFRPRSVAVIGASRNRGGIAGEVFHNLIEFGFNGPVYPVNPEAAVVQSVPAYPSVLDVPGPVDLAVLVVPAAAAVEVAKDCAAKGVRALVVVSSGFAEVGEEGRALQHELVSVCRSSGMRLIGPNCMGIVNTDPNVRLNATFAPDPPILGRVGFLSQSGALGLAVIDRATALGLGLSSFVSVGNKADISGNDLIHFWESDEGTDLILLYLESFGNPRKFSRITRRVGKAKPIVAVKSGRSLAGARATTSHTGALIAASDVTVDALFRQAGVIRTDSLREMFDVASLLANQPAATGRRVGIVTNAGGPGILCADACEGHGLEVPALPEEIQRELAGFLPPEAALWNPVDMIASASGEDYRKAIEIVATGGGVDALIAIFVPPLVTKTEDVAAGVRRAVVDMGGGIPVLSVFMSSAGAPAQLAGEDIRIPSYEFPEEAAAALARAVDYGRWRSEPEGVVPAFADARREEAAGAIATALARGPGWLPPDEVAALLSCYGLALAEWRLVDSPAAAGRAARELGGPVALKAVAPTLVHKTEARGVRLSLAGPTRVTAAAREMAEEVAAAGHTVERFLVQRMVEGGVEMLVGMVHDPVFGPVVACGAGGVAVELMNDVAVRITPLTDLDATAMVRSLATFPLLDGYRGAPKADVAELEDILLRVSALVENHPEVAELDCNPVEVLPEAAVIVDARVRVEVPAPRLPLAARRT